MRVHIFRGPADHLYGFTADETGTNLPADVGPWTYWKTIEINRGGQTLFSSFDVDEILDGLERDGHHIKAGSPWVSAPGP
jgi:hypothetical protein